MVWKRFSCRNIASPPSTFLALKNFLYVFCFFFRLDESIVNALESKYETDYEMMLVEKIMKNYKAKVEVRPVERSDQPIVVTFDLAYTQLIDLV